MAITLLHPNDHAKLDSIFETEWQAYAPRDHAHILADVEDGELAAFIPMEDVVLVSGVYVAPNYRGDDGSARILRLVRHLKKSAAESGRSFIMARHGDRAEHFMGFSEALGFYKYADAVYRTDKFRKD